VLSVLQQAGEFPEALGLHATLAFTPQAYVTACQDPAFREEFEQLGKDFIGRPTPMYHAKRLSSEIGGAQVSCP